MSIKPPRPKMLMRFTNNSKNKPATDTLHFAPNYIIPLRSTICPEARCAQCGLINAIWKLLAYFTPKYGSLTPS